MFEKTGSTKHITEMAKLITVCKYILVLQKLKCWVFILFVISKDFFEEINNSEKINVEISGGPIRLDDTAPRPAQILRSPADQRNLWEQFTLDS